ncbi:MAG: methylated-DNA--[protein]-cysteine S-methyltransferase [Myxococcota bacterium]
MFADFDVIESPIGWLLLTADRRGLTGIHQLNGPPTFNGVRELFPSPVRFTEVKAQLMEYFAGERLEFAVPLAHRGTDVQRAVWAALILLPYGVTVSVDDLAQRLRLSVHEVALAAVANPVSVVIPCHRLVDPLATGAVAERRRALVALETGETFAPLPPLPIPVPRHAG